jgi:nucleoside phosphorylase
MTHTRAMEWLADNLALCRQDGYRPYTLLLTSSVVFPPEVRQQVCQASSWHDFQTYLSQRGSREKRAVLLQAARTPQLLSGYLALARLLTGGFFTTVLSCDPTPHLAEALWQVSSQRPFVLAVGSQDERQIAETLDNPPDGPCLIQLHGDLLAPHLPPAFPLCASLPAALHQPLKRHLNREMLVVGELEADRDVADLLQRKGDHSLYYALAETPGPYDAVMKTLEARGLAPEQHIIKGAPGQCHIFFTALAARLLPPAVQVEISGAESPGVRSDRRVTPGADVLLVTVNAIETEAVLELFPHKRSFQGAHQSYHDLGEIEGARVFLVQQADMGAMSAYTAVKEGIGDLAPHTVIMVGIAFGLHQGRHQIGDILVSQRLQDYEPQRIGSGAENEQVVLLRGGSPDASHKLLSRFRSGIQDWPEKNVHVGLLLSGNKLIAHSGYRDQIHAFAPEALGGEMEGIGIYRASHDHHVDWILAKAISDWADDKKGHNKEQNQRQAARNAARFVLHVLRRGGFTG